MSDLQQAYKDNKAQELEVYCPEKGIDSMFPSWLYSLLTRLNLSVDDAFLCYTVYEILCHYPSLKDERRLYFVCHEIKAIPPKSKLISHSLIVGHVLAWNPINFKGYPRNRFHPCLILFFTFSVPQLCHVILGSGCIGRYGLCLFCFHFFCP